MNKELKKLLIVLVVLVGVLFFLKPWLTQPDVAEMFPIGMNWYEALDVIGSHRKLWLSAPPDGYPRASLVRSFQDGEDLIPMRVKIEYGHFIYRHFIQTYIDLRFDEGLMLRELELQQAWKI
ncbi:MAG: hypothetical protein FWG87_06245 [Defluviitaleaceae bacterium]|nr:hypothetical protein [Defluviitaleaceae bacterium]